MAGAWFVPIAWELDEGKVLVIDYEIPTGSPYVGICLTNRWSEMIDISTRQTSLNLAQSHTDGDHVRLLVSTADVGVDNWLDARGYSSGVVTWRATAADQPATPTATVIDVDDLDEYFGPSRRVTAEQRAAALLARQRHFAERDAL
jgi:hypothetical protein